MFSSSYPFPQLTSSIHACNPLPFFNHDKDDIFLDHHHNNLLADDFFQPNNASPSLIENAGTWGMVAAAGPTSQDFIRQLKGSLHCDSVISSRKKPAKKDRHSKIFTAQGARDRRVRLSIQIARKFFDLQDMLGFDKASKTLDWLFTNSKTAIKELVEMKQGLCSITGEADYTERASQQQGEYSKKQPQKYVGKGKNVESTFHLLTKESRARARARARERTREKMQIRKLGELNKLLSDDLDQSSCCSQMEAQSKDIIGESTFVNHKLLKPYSICTHQQNLVISKDFSSKIKYSYYPKITEK